MEWHFFDIGFTSLNLLSFMLGIIFDTTYATLGKLRFGLYFVVFYVLMLVLYLLLMRGGMSDFLMMF